MKKIILLSLLLIGFGQATEYRLVHLKKGGTLNIRELPRVNARTVVGKIPANATGISIRECKVIQNGTEWCYVNYPLGGDHIEGWVNSYFLAPMGENYNMSKVHIKNFLHNFYLADEENFLDKLQVFYKFPMQKYLWKKNISLMELRAKKVRYYKKWPKRDYKMTYMKILKRKPNYIDVQTTVRWKVKRYNDYESGKDIQKIRLIPNANSFKVLALKNLRHTVFPKPKVLEENNVTLVKSSEENLTVESKEVETPLVLNSTLSTEAVSKKYYIKVGSFFSKIDSNYLKGITQSGLSYKIQKVKQDNSIISRVFVGPFETTMEVTKALPFVRENISKDAYIQSF